MHTINCSNWQCYCVGSLFPISICLLLRALPGSRHGSKCEKQAWRNGNVWHAAIYINQIKTKSNEEIERLSKHTLRLAYRYIGWFVIALLWNKWNAIRLRTAWHDSSLLTVSLVASTLEYSQSGQIIWQMQSHFNCGPNCALSSLVSLLLIYKQTTSPTLH